MIFGKYLPKHIHKQFVELNRIENYFRVAYAEVKNNTALVHNSQDFAKQLESVVKLVSQRKQALLSNTLAHMGITAANVNLDTGRIKVIKNLMQARQVMRTQAAQAADKQPR